MDYYAILGLTHSATADDIRRAYGRLIDALSPGVGKDPNATRRLAQIKAAYDVLGDLNKRTLYDLESMERDLEASERELNTDFFGPPSNTGDLDAAEVNGMTFEEELAAVMAEIQRPPIPTLRAPPSALEDRPRQEVRRRPLRGSNCQVVLEVQLEDAIRGATVQVTYAVAQYSDVLPVKEERSVEIQIPKLARHHQKLLVRGKGGPGIDGGEPGDLMVEISYKRHRLFRLSGDDVWYHFPIAPWEAVLGAILEIPTLEDPFRVHLPAGTTSGQTFRLPGRGLPKVNGGRGDLLASLRILTPKFPSDAEKQLYLQLAQVSRFNPRRGIT